MSRTIKWSLAIIALLYAAYQYNNRRKLADLFEVKYTKQELIDNYELRSNQVSDVKRYVNEVVPVGMTVEIEFTRDSEDFDIFHVQKNGKWNSNWNVGYDSQKADSLLQSLGWTKETVNVLRSKLAYANCISVESGEPCTVGFQRSGMGKYFYKIFAQPLNDTLISEYNDGCQYIYYKDNIVLEYGGGAVGPQCFEGYTGGKN
jgi:hypothetical protein